MEINLELTMHLATSPAVRNKWHLRVVEPRKSLSASLRHHSRTSLENFPQNVSIGANERHVVLSGKTAVQAVYRQGRLISIEG